MTFTLSLPLPSLLLSTPFTRGGGTAGHPAISKTVALMKVKFCRVLETSLNVLEILKLFIHTDYLVTIVQLLK